MADRIKRKLTDWDSIEPLYRAGILSNCEICRQYEADHIHSQTWKLTVGESAIRKQAKVKGWLRDIADKVRKQVRENLVRVEMRNASRLNKSHQILTEKQIIDKAAEAGSNIVLRHRLEIKKLEENETILLIELKDLSETFQPKGPSLKDRSNILKNISGVMAQRIALERQAHGLDDGGGNDDPYREMADADLAKKIDAYKARLLS